MNNDNIVYNIPVLPLRGLVVFPKMMLHFDAGRAKTINAINKSMNKDQMIFLSSQKDASVSNPQITDIYKIGVVCKIVQIIKAPENVLRVVVEGQYRAKIVSDDLGDKCMIVDVERIDTSDSTQTSQTIALIRSLKSVFEEYVQLTPKLPSDIMFKIGLCEDAGELADYIAGNINFDYYNKQIILETLDVLTRLETLIEMLMNEVYILGIEKDINIKARQKIDDNQRDYFLREQLSVIEEELGIADSPESEAVELRNKVLALKLPDDVQKALVKECNKLEKMPFGSHEGSVISTYIDVCVGLPWNKSTKEKINISKVRKDLDKNHYGLNKVKEKIIEQLAVKQLSPDVKSQILCLVGPPGVGKTSIAQSIAKAINRKCERIALGGVKDESEIRGHRKTYLGSMPGRIINALKHAEANNPLIILDEIDKLASDYKGDPTSALLEVLDAEQNYAFHDHYIDLPFDLSKVMFITTANDYASIPAALRDRMEVIELDSYTHLEKFNIAKKHLIPKQLKNCALSNKTFKLSDGALNTLIEGYTKEAGVRELERMIASIMKKAAVKLIDTGCAKITVNEKDLEGYLGPKKYLKDISSKENEVGVVNGLAWTSVGGTLLPIEVAVMDGTGKIELTGSLGDVMQESAKTAITCIRSNADKLSVDSLFYKDKDIHIHAPEGAVPKDGPSAGITMATAIYSALSHKPVNKDFAMTGEITLRGKVLAIGGLKEKSMAAYKAGIKNVIIPKDNYSDVALIDDVVKANVNFIPVDNIFDVLSLAIVEFKKSKDKKTEILLNKSDNTPVKTVRQ